MKYQAPDHIRGAISVGGENVQIAADGTFELPDGGDYMSILPFGCKLLPPPATATQHPDMDHA